MLIFLDFFLCIYILWYEFVTFPFPLDGSHVTRLLAFFSSPFLSFIFYSFLAFFVDLRFTANLSYCFFFLSIYISEMSVFKTLLEMRMIKFDLSNVALRNPIFKL